MVSGEVLAELRAIRDEIRTLSERLSLAASREDLKGYVTQQQFDDHLAAESDKKQDWRWWAVYAMSGMGLLLGISGHIALILK